MISGTLTRSIRRSMIGSAFLACLPVLVPAALADQPDRTLDSYGAWELRCERLPPQDTGPAFACEVIQTIQLQGQSQLLSRIAIGRPGPQADPVLVVQLPLGIWLPAGVAFDFGAGAGRHPAELRRCLPAGCLAELPLTESILTALRTNGATRSAVEFAMQPNENGSVPLVHQGFAAAYEAMERRMRAD